MSCLLGENLSVLESKIREYIKLSARGGKTHLPVQHMSCLLGENLSVLESKIREYIKLSARGGKTHLPREHMSCLLGENLILPQLKLFTPTLTFRTVKGSNIKKETPLKVKNVLFKNCCLCQGANAHCIIHYTSG
jgi:hypothetical protein